jgi:hypothetical protein
MSVSANFHGANSATAWKSSGTEWLQIECKDNSYACFFMPYDVAKAMADTFNAAVKAEVAA